MNKFLRRCNKVLSSGWFLWLMLIASAVMLFDTYRTHDLVWTALFTVNLCYCIDAIRKLPKRAKPSGKETPCADSQVLVGAPLTDEQIEEIWNSLGYRTKFAPYMLRLVRAVQSHASNKDAATLATIRAAINGYYFALVQRQHGSVAQTEAFDKIEQALDMHESKGKN